MSNGIKTKVVKPEVEFYIKDTLYRLVDEKVEESLDEKISVMDTYLPSPEGLDISEEEKDVLYVGMKEKINAYKDELRECDFNFHLNRSQYRFLTDLLLKKMDYDVNQIFIAIELTTLLGTMKEASYKNDDELLNFTTSATNITYIYHLISTHKVKGLTKDAYSFSEVLLRIGELSGLISYYDTYAKNIVDEYTQWVYEISPVDPNVSMGELIQPGEVQVTEVTEDADVTDVTEEG